MKKLTEEWISKAEDDSAVAEREYACKKPVYDAVCFHAQQCVEKYMKAVLQENNTAFEKTHDLDLLLQKCEGLIPELKDYKKELLELSSFAVEIRYPGMTAEKEEALSCLSVMRKVVKLIKKYFKIN